MEVNLDGKFGGLMRSDIAGTSPAVVPELVAEAAIMPASDNLRHVGLISSALELPKQKSRPSHHPLACAESLFICEMLEPLSGFSSKTLLIILPTNIH